MRIKTKFYLVVTLTIFLCVSCTIAADYVIFRRDLARAIGERDFFLLIYPLILAGGVLFATLLAHTVFPRLETGARFAESVIPGALPSKLKTGRDELGMMFQAFNVMIDQQHSANATIARLEREVATANHQIETQNDRLEILIEARTDELKQAHRHMLDLSPTAMIIIRDGVALQVNEKGAALFGLRPGDHVSGIFADDWRKEKILSLMERGETMREFPTKMSGAEGEPLDALLTLHPFIYEGKSSLIGWISDVTDITRGKATTKEAERERGFFSAAVSNDNCNPLNAILKEISKKYDSDDMEKAVSEFSRFTHNDHQELIEWIVWQAKNLEYDKIAEGLEKSGL